MKYLVMSLISGFLFIFGVIFITNYYSGDVAEYSYVGIWESETETGESFEVSFSDTHLTIEGRLMEYKVLQKDDWLLFVTENKEEITGQVPSNELILLFKIHGRNKLELLSFGMKPVDASLLTRK